MAGFRTAPEGGERVVGKTDEPQAAAPAPAEDPRDRWLDDFLAGPPTPLPRPMPSPRPQAQARPWRRRSRRRV